MIKNTIKLKNFIVNSVSSILILIFIYFSYKLIKDRIDYLYDKYDINNYFIKWFGEINIFNTLLILLVLYFIISTFTLLTIEKILDQSIINIK